MTMLTCGLHDPHGGLLWIAKKYADVLTKIFHHVHMTASPNTDPELLIWLQEHGCTIHHRRTNNIPQTYFEAIQRGVETKAETIFYCDADRALHWARTYPAELKRAAAMATKADYFVGMRGPKEHQSHHDALYYTEQLPNAIISERMEEKMRRDYLSGCYGFSQKAATYIVKHMKADSLSLYGDWPLIMKRHGFKPTYRICKGLGWETPDQHTDDVERLGSVDAYREWLSSPAEWKRRAKMALEFVEKITPNS